MAHPQDPCVCFPSEGIPRGCHACSPFVWTLGDPNSGLHASEANTLIHWAIFQGHSSILPQTSLIKATGIIIRNGGTFLIEQYGNCYLAHNRQKWRGRISTLSCDLLKHESYTQHQWPPFSFMFSLLLLPPQQILINSLLNKIEEVHCTWEPLSFFLLSTFGDWSPLSSLHGAGDGVRARLWPILFLVTLFETLNPFPKLFFYFCHFQMSYFWNSLKILLLKPCYNCSVLCLSRGNKYHQSNSHLEL